jgi:hypothetical protein
MSFDKNGPSPIINGKKPTTKVNMFIVIAVLIFFVIGAYLAWRLLWQHPHDLDPGHDLGAVFQVHGDYCSIPHSQLVEIKEADHLPQVEAFDQYIRALSNFLALRVAAGALDGR